MISPSITEELQSNPTRALLGAAGAFLVVGLFMYGRAMSGRDKAKRKSLNDVCLEAGNACITGGAVALAVVFLQLLIDEGNERQKAEQELQTQLLMTADLSGFDPPPRDRGQIRDARGRISCDQSRVDDAELRLRTRYLTAKRLNGARLDGLHLQGAKLRDAQLRGATLACANLESTELLGADLAYADLGGSRLAGADLRSASLQFARLDGVEWQGKGARGPKVNGRTCWPPGALLGQSAAGPEHSDAVLERLRSRGVEPRRMAPANERLYGHICGTTTMITEEGIELRTREQVEPAPGEVLHSDAEPELTQEAMVAAIRQIVAEQETAPQYSPVGNPPSGSEP